MPIIVHTQEPEQSTHSHLRLFFRDVVVTTGRANPFKWCPWIPFRWILLGGFLWWAVRNLSAMWGDLNSILGLGRSPGGGHGNPLQYSCLENPHGQRSLVGCSPWGHKESDKTERWSTAQPGWGMGWGRRGDFAFCPKFSCTIFDVFLKYEHEFLGWIFEKQI